jgi:hypothetical protein
MEISSNLRGVCFEHAKPKDWHQTDIDIIRRSDFIVPKCNYYVYGTDTTTEAPISFQLQRETVDPQKVEIVDNKKNMLAPRLFRRMKHTKEYQAAFVAPQRRINMAQHDVAFIQFMKGLKIDSKCEDCVEWSAQNGLENQSGQTSFTFFIIRHSDDDTPEQVVGYACVEILTPPNPNYHTLRPYNTNCYISDVTIHPNFRNTHLCVPLVSFVVQTLKHMGYEKIYIENSSRTKQGIPACFCYYKAGVQNDYNMYYQPNEHSLKLRKLTPLYCKTGQNNTNYYYISKNIGRTAKRKLRTSHLARHLHKISYKKKMIKKK